MFLLCPNGRILPTVYPQCDLSRILWGRSWIDYLMAVLIGLVLVAGLAVAILSRDWILALVWVVLLVGALVTWVRDLLNAIRRRP